MNKIIKFNENQPHLSIPLIDDSVLIIPVRYIEELINGKQKLRLTEDNEILILTIIKEWYENMQKINPGSV